MKMTIRLQKLVPNGGHVWSVRSGRETILTSKVYADGGQRDRDVAAFVASMAFGLFTVEKPSLLKIK